VLSNTQISYYLSISMWASADQLRLPIKHSTNQLKLKITLMDSKQIDYQSLNYLSAVDHNLYCPICRSPLVDPVYTTCLHTFCSACISKALERSQTCPVDRTPLRAEDVSPAPIMIANLVNELAVLCPNSELGCPFTCSRYLVEAHLSHDCGFVYVKCRGCDGKVLKQDAGRECLHQLEECTHCFQQIKKIDMEVCYCSVFNPLLC